MISMSWRAAWKTLVTASLAISAKNGLEIQARRQRIDQRGETPGAAIWIRHSSGQNVVSRMNSVSTVTNVGLFDSSETTAASSSGGRDHMHPYCLYRDALSFGVFSRAPSRRALARPVTESRPHRCRCRRRCFGLQGGRRAGTSATAR
jgi:hypothetical protein